MAGKVWQRIEHNVKRYQYLGIAESRIHNEQELRDLDAKARGLHLRMHANRARRYDRPVSEDEEARSKGGGSRLRISALKRACYRLRVSLQGTSENKANLDWVDSYANLDWVDSYRW